MKMRRHPVSMHIKAALTCFLITFSFTQLRAAPSGKVEKDFRVSTHEFLLATNLGPIKSDNSNVATGKIEVTANKGTAETSPSQIQNQTRDPAGGVDTPEELRRIRNTAPFFVKVGSTKFYGGLITIGHELHPACICRLLNACVRNDGTVVLPEWMRRYDEMLSFDCGIEKLEFSLTDTNAPPPLHNLDLFGSEVTSAEVRKFIGEFAPTLVAFDMMSGEREVSITCRSRLGKGCRFFSRNVPLRPAILLDPEVDAQPWKSSWIKSFLRLVPTQTFKHRVRLLPLRELFTMQSDEEVQCFRSAVLTRSPRTKFSINPDMLRELSIFGKNNISKMARIVRMSNEESAKCHINIMFLNRKKPAANSPQPGIAGFISNIWRLRREIKRRVAKFRSLGLRVRVNAVTLDDKRLRYQIDAMQKSDVIIGGTNDFLANMIFLRDKCSVIELMPFGFYPKHYEKMARYTANVKYDQYIAHPDVHTFRDCLFTVAPPGSANYSRALQVMKRFKKVASRYYISDNTHSYTLHNMKHEFDFVRPCAMAQKLNSNATLFAMAIVRHARIRCGIKLAHEF